MKNEAENLNRPEGEHSMPRLFRDLPRPRLPRPIFLKGVQFEGETPEDMAKREANIEEAIRKIDAEEQRLWKWKTTPIWEM